MSQGPAAADARLVTPRRPAPARPVAAPAVASSPSPVSPAPASPLWGPETHDGMTLAVVARDTPAFQKGVRTVMRRFTDPSSPEDVTLVPSAHPKPRSKDTAVSDRPLSSAKHFHVGWQDTAFTMLVTDSSDTVVSDPAFLTARVGKDSRVEISTAHHEDEAARFVIYVVRVTVSRRELACHLSLVGYDGFLSAVTTDAQKFAGFRLAPTVSSEVVPTNSALWQLSSPAGAPAFELTPLIAPLFKQPAVCMSAAIPHATLAAWAAASGYGISSLREDAVLWAADREMRLGSGGFGQVYVAAVAAKASASGSGCGSRPIAAAAVKAFQRTGSDDIEMTEISESCGVEHDSEAASTLVSNRPALAVIRELKPVKEVVHPHIVPIWGFNVGGGGAWLLMPRCTSDCSDTFFTARAVDWPAFFSAAVGVARALDYLHTHPVQKVHNDLKPHNLLLDDGGCVRLSDFGIARISADHTGVVSAGGAIGTPAYAAPENYASVGGKDRAKPPSDIFSYGATLHALLTRRHPRPTDYGRGTPAGSAVCVPALAFPSETPPRLQALITSCVAFRPADRPSAAKVLSELEVIVAESGTALGVSAAFAFRIPQPLSPPASMSAGRPTTARVAELAAARVDADKVAKEDLAALVALVPLGARVRRGPTWKYADQDGGDGKLGTVVGYSDRRKGIVKVHWDANGDKWAYRMDGAPGLPAPGDKRDLVVIAAPPAPPSGGYPAGKAPSESGDLSVIAPLGSRVRRGPNWRWDNQDGGDGNLGTVIKHRIGDSSCVKVAWDSGHSNFYYRMYRGAWDLIVVAAPSPCGPVAVPPDSPESPELLLPPTVPRIAPAAPAGAAASPIREVPAAPAVAVAPQAPAARLGVGLEERIPRGTRVRRGPSWKCQWGEQDGGDGKLGTVYGYSTSGWVEVCWDADGSQFRYRFDDFARDLIIVAVLPPPPAGGYPTLTPFCFGEVEVLVPLGARVRRGSKWAGGNQDGGDGCLGTVLGYEADATGNIVVMWDIGRTHAYNYTHLCVVAVPTPVAPEFQASPRPSACPPPKPSPAGAASPPAMQAAPKAPIAVAPAAVPVRAAAADSKLAGEVVPPTSARASRRVAWEAGGDADLLVTRLPTLARVAPGPAPSPRAEPPPTVAAAAALVLPAASLPGAASPPSESDASASASEASEAEGMAAEDVAALAALAPLGARVRRGPTWKWLEQDGGDGELGTVFRYDTKGWVRVLWDANGDDYEYRMEGKPGPRAPGDKRDLVVVAAPAPPSGSYAAGKAPSESGNMSIIAPLGSRVRRGPDWRWDNQDGGDGNLGIVIRHRNDDKRCVDVIWDDGRCHDYRMYRGAWDLIVVAVPEAIPSPESASPSRPLALRPSTPRPAAAREGSRAATARVTSRPRAEPAPSPAVPPADASLPAAPELLAESVPLGSRVRRGPAWVYGDQDGGSGLRGTIVACTAPGHVSVKWDSGKLCAYRLRPGVQDLVLAGGLAAAPAAAPPVAAHTAAAPSVPAAGGAYVTVAPPSRKWACMLCTLLNDPTRLHCDACDAPRQTEELARPPPPPPPPAAAAAAPLPRPEVGSFVELVSGVLPGASSVLLPGEVGRIIEDDHSTLPFHIVGPRGDAACFRADDVRVAPRPAHLILAPVPPPGTLVRRGPDWGGEDIDGGPRGIGMVLAPDSTAEGVVAVVWFLTGRLSRTRWRRRGRQGLEEVPPDSPDAALFLHLRTASYDPAPGASGGVCVGAAVKLLVGSKSDSDFRVGDVCEVVAYDPAEHPRMPFCVLSESGKGAWASASSLALEPGGLPAGRRQAMLPSGTVVRRGPGWRSGSDDGVPGGTGSVVWVNGRDGHVFVYWDGPQTVSCVDWGLGGIWELEVSTRK